ncbi:MAG: hypothetical protein JKY52_09230 [Flavobacteriales bacterium]|nr:hypothetical protein [Flavobacteriales bacterium]
MNDFKEHRLKDGTLYYLASDVDEHITDLDCELNDANETNTEIMCNYETQEDYGEQCKSLKSWLRISADTLKTLDQSQEVTLHGKITDIAGFISDIEWELKA